MVHHLENEYISISIKQTGAELCSLRKKGDSHEYIWTGDAQFWAGQSPVLFPIVGSLRNETTHFGKQEYSMKNHGFARRRNFNRIEADPECICLELREDADTLQQYPFAFALRLTYTLNANSVTIQYEVENTDDQPILFQLGTHPGFICPMEEGLDLSDYFLEFEQEETATRYFCSSSNLIVEGKSEQLLAGSKYLPLSSSLFYEGALIFRNLRSQQVTLKSNRNPRHVHLQWTNFPYLGIWQPTDAPFVCIEPWHGVGDPDQHNVAFSEKEQIVTLKPGQKFHAAIIISV